MGQPDDLVVDERTGTGSFKVPSGLAHRVVMKRQPWLEIVLVGEDEETPVAKERYQVTLPDGSVREGRLDDAGKARLTDIARPGMCKVTFPDLDAGAWELLEPTGDGQTGGSTGPTG